MAEQIELIDVEGVDEIAQLRNKQVNSPEIEIALLLAKTSALATAYLIVSDDWYAEVNRQEAEWFHVGTGSAGSSVYADQRYKFAIKAPP